MKKLFCILFAAIVAASCAKETEKADITGAWSYVSGTVKVDGVAVPSYDAERFIDMKSAIFTFNADGTLKYEFYVLGDSYLTGDYLLDRKTMQLDMTIDDESIFPITVKKLTDKEMIWAFEENANMDYSDGDFHYNTNDKHLIRQEWFFTKLQ